MGDFKNLTGKLIIASLFILAIFSFMIITQSDNEAVDPLTNQDVFNDSLQGLIQTIDTSTEVAESKYGVFNSEEPKAGFGSIVLFGIVSIGKSFSNIIFGLFGAIIKLPLAVLGIPATIYNQLLSWLIILVVVAVWLLYKLGG